MKDRRPTAAATGGVCFMDILLLINIVLKLAGIGEVATWGWALVLWPLWFEIGIFAIIMLVVIWLIKR